MNDKGRYHSLKSTARERSCGRRWLAFIATLPPEGRGCSKPPRTGLRARVLGSLSRPNFRVARQRPQSEAVCGDGSGHVPAASSHTRYSGAPACDRCRRPELLQQPNGWGLMPPPSQPIPGGQIDRVLMSDCVGLSAEDDWIICRLAVSWA